MMQMDSAKLTALGESGKQYSRREFGRRTLIDRIENALKSLK
jgi:hypothetical protein